jgi:perosamine synthetase
MEKIPIAEPSLGQEELENITRAVKTNWVSSKGEFIEQFENDFSRYGGVKHGSATSNGTTALHLALLALGIKKGDEVIVPDLTFAATANAAIYCGAKPVLVDAHPDYWCIDPAKIEEKITSKTKAIIPVHLYGHPCDMKAIMDIARDHKLFVVEDVAEAHGSEYRGKKSGSFGDISCFSFYGNKIITTGEGGMCLTNDEALSRKMKILRDHGMNPDKRYWHDEIGFNYRMTNLQAAIGVAQVKKLDSFIEKKRQIAKWYSKGLKEASEKEVITIHPEMPWAKCVYWMYSILVEGKGRRDLLMKKLEAEGIETRPFFYPLHEMPPYRTKDPFDVSSELSLKGINLPSSVSLTEDQVNKIARVITQKV